MKRLILFFTFFILGISSKAQIKEDILYTPFKETKAPYLNITKINFGKTYKLKTPKDLNNAGYLFRIVISHVNNSHSIYIEKLIIDIDDELSRIAWSRMVDTEAITEHLKLNSEHIEVSNIKWIDQNHLFLRINNQLLKLSLYNKDKLKVIIGGGYDNILSKLEIAYQADDLSKLKTILNKWHKEIQANTAEEITKNKKIKTIHDIYKAFRRPINHSHNSINYKDNWPEKSNYIIIQTSLEYTILTNNNIAGFKESSIKKYDTISNFRTNIKLGDKKILYLTPEYKRTLEKFIEKDSLCSSISLKSLAANTTDESRTGFLEKYLPRIHSHFEYPWLFETNPIVERIVINKRLNKAIVYFRDGCEGGETTMKKVKGKWIIQKLEWTWID